MNIYGPYEPVLGPSVARGALMRDSVYGLTRYYKEYNKRCPISIHP